MKVVKETNGSKRELITVLKVAGAFAVILSLVSALFAAVDMRSVGLDAALPLFSLSLQLFFAGMMMLAGSAGLDLLGGLSRSLADDEIETRRYGRTRSNKGSILASKLAAEPAAH